MKVQHNNLVGDLIVQEAASASKSSKNNTTHNVKDSDPWSVTKYRPFRTNLVVDCGK